MAEQDEQNKGASLGGTSEFEAMFEESLRTVKPGGIVKGRVVGITSTHVLIDVGYKSEGQIPIHEFRNRDGSLDVQEGEEIDVCALGRTVGEAQARAYQAVDRIRWADGFCRRDIGFRAIEREGLEQSKA